MWYMLKITNMETVQNFKKTVEFKLLWNKYLHSLYNENKCITLLRDYYKHGACYPHSTD
jgi:hypothetical protein